LQTTPDGRPKVIDVVDASGGDDIDTSTTVVQLADNDGNVVITGNSITLYCFEKKTLISREKSLFFCLLLIFFKKM
jgi:hypothetical protein